MMVTDSGRVSADELPIVRALERGADALTLGTVWQAAGVIKALYSALSEARPEIWAIAQCCHEKDRSEIRGIVHRADLALEAARR